METITKEKSVAFLDIGTNSVRLLLVRINPNLTYTTISLQREPVRLGEGEFTDGYLRPEAINRAMVVCKQFADMARSNDAKEIIAVATSATREAKNQKHFLQLLKHAARLNVRVISGVEEARLIYLGVANGIHLDEKTALMIDIGGGSTELIVGDSNAYQFLDSLKLGAIRLSTQFLNKNVDEPISTKDISTIKQHIRNTSIRAIQNVSSKDYNVTFGSSGTIKNLGDIIIQRYETRPRLREDVITLDQIKDTLAYLASLPLAERINVPGISPKRADIIVPGSLILQTILEELSINELHISDQSLHDGMLIEYLSRDEHAEIVEEKSVRMRSVLQLARKCNYDKQHADTVIGLAMQMFDSAKEVGLHKMNGNYRELLHYSAILHDIGIFLNYSNHQEHSYYLIKNADLLGFDQKEIELMAAVSFFHRKKFPKKKHSQMKNFGPRTRANVQKMTMLLRIAESLDRSHKGAIHNARFISKKNKTAHLEIACNQEAQLELWGAQHHRKSFQKAFGRVLHIAQAAGESC